MGADARSSRNRTIVLDEGERAEYAKRVLRSGKGGVEDSVIHGDCFEVLREVPENFVDLVVADPPYNLGKVYSGNRFKKRPAEEYREWLDGWLRLVPRVLKPDSSVYICCDWTSSSMVYDVASRYFNVLNRISWEREKGRGSRKNWKNCVEDIWYLSNGKNPGFNSEQVKVMRRVIAPYREEGIPRDWQDTPQGKFRLTCSSNFWTDLTVPFWSMSENTEHPAQKPEKLVAKIVLASSDRGDMVLDPFLGSGTTAVVARKLGRRFLGIESEYEYCLLALKRIDMAGTSTRIQGYEQGIFLERNTRSGSIPDRQ